MQPRRVDLGAVLNAHPYLRVERPPALWQPDVDDEPFIRMLGEMIAAALARNDGVLAEITLNASNVVIEPAAAGRMPAGEFVAITIRSAGDWRPELARAPQSGASPALVNRDVEAAAAKAGAAWAYTRQTANDAGSVTMLFGRAAT